MKTFMILLSYFCMASCDKNAMFGLDWGMSPSSIEAMGVALTETSVQDNLHIYECDLLPKNYSLAKKYLLAFDKDSSLIKIKMVTELISNDPFGKEGKERFDNLLSLFKSKFEINRIYCDAGNESYKPDEFYESLMGSGSWEAVLKDSNKNIRMELKGLEKGVGFMQVIIEVIPFNMATND
jgi:hypothetical protein